jgi:hypothetical protein
MSMTELFPENLVDGFERVSSEADIAQRAELGQEKLPDVIEFCRGAAPMIVAAKEAIRKDLSDGMESGRFVAIFGPLFIRLQRTLGAVDRLRKTIPRDATVPLAVETLSELDQLAAGLADVGDLVGGALAKAKQPPPSLNQDRIAEVEAAFAAGKTRPFQKSLPASED